MTATRAPAPQEQTSTDRARRWLLAGAMVLAPLLLLAGSLLEIDTGTEEGAATLALVAADREQFYAAGLLLALGLSMLPVCAIGVMQLTRGRGGVLGTVGGSLVVVAGAAAGAAIFLYTAVLYLGSDPALDRDAIGALDERASDSMAIGIAFMIGFLGIAVGMALLGAALWRAGTVPRWVAAPIGVAGLAGWFSEETWSIVLTTSAFLALIGCAVELVRAPAPAQVVLPDAVPAQAAGRDVSTPTPTAG